MARKGAAGKDGTEAPAKQGMFTRLRTTLAQTRTVYTMTRKGDPTALWVMLAGGLAVLGAMVGIGYLVGHPLYFLILGLPLSFMAGLVIMARRAEKVAYSHIQGQAGASLAALRNLRRGWNVEQYPVAVDPRTQDVVFRALGRPGIVLITEGPMPRVGKLAEQERKKHARLLPNVPITVINSGEGEGMVELRRLSPTVMKLKPALTKDEVTEVSKRLRAMGGAKPAIPKGVDPLRARPDRKASRGR
jgi:F0F1-type ATP synthase assembly protein I